MEHQDDAYDEEQGTGLVRLSRVSYRLAEGQPDAMGWEVADADGRGFGRVSDLLADIDSGQIVFVAVEMNDSGRSVLVPVEGTHLDETSRQLVVPASEDEVEGGPDFTDDVVDVSPFVDYWLRAAAASFRNGGA